MNTARGKYDGVIEILRYNWHYYAASVCVIAGIFAVIRLHLVTGPGQFVLIAAATITAFWSLSSLLASYYIYDYAGVTRWTWLPRMLLSAPHRWVNIHSGLDQSTEVLTQLFPSTGSLTVDIYDPQEMTEPSIARARQVHPSLQPAIAGKLDALPLPDRDRDTLFVLFAAHEIRKSKRRTAFFQEAARVLGSDGRLLLVEHLRDWKNFAAFGPGFLHFYSRNEWLRAATQAGFMLQREDRVTPFVRCFLLAKTGV